MGKYIIDRRLNPKGKSLSNRQRFLKRAKKQIQERLKKNIIDRSITDERGEDVSIPVGDIDEPSFGHDSQSGDQDFVLPGNTDYTVGDTIPKPQGGAGGGGSKGSPDGEGEDDFEFHISRDEYLDIVFEDLELPRLEKKQNADTKSFTNARAGYVTDGNPSQLDIVKSITTSLGRRIGLGRHKHLRRIAEIEETLEKMDCGYRDGNKLEMCRLLEDELLMLKNKLKALPFIDPIDLRFRNYVKVPKPITKAAMVCVMDVSASMGEKEKELAKRFYLLLYLFLKTKYEHVDVAFVRHHMNAKEVDEEGFFNGKESGGTLVSSGLKLANEIIEERYDQSEWNTYVAQCSDGDNFTQDMSATRRVMEDKLLPTVNYFFYVEIDNSREYSAGYALWGYDSGITEMWTLYSILENQYDNLSSKKVKDKSDIMPVFREIFKKEENADQ